MSEIITYKLEGVNEVLDALDSLETKELMKIIRAIQRKALMKNLVSPVRSAIPEQRLKSSVKVTNDRKEKLSMYAGVTVSKRKDPNEPPEGVVLKWLEKGTDIRTTEKGANRGQIIARNRIEPIIMSSPDSIIEFFTNDFGEEINKILEKKIKKIK